MKAIQIIIKANKNTGYFAMDYVLVSFVS